jgi:hypothetical protein
VDDLHAVAARELVPPARYLPFLNGRYEVAAGLSRLGKDFGNGLADSRVFQIDDQFAGYRATKLQSRRERLAKYYCTTEMDPALRRAVIRWFVERLTYEYPSLFESEKIDDGEMLDCALTGERLGIDRSGKLLAIAGPHRLTPRYADALDALACQVQEDVAVVRMDAPGGDRLVAVHLCFPNHWAAEEKVGRDFVAVHGPVAGFAPLAAKSGVMVRMMIEATQGLVRFAWGVGTDDGLNQHPEGATARRRFDRASPRAFVRIERQVIWGLPEVSAAIFTIRTYHLDCAEVRKDPTLRQSLLSAIESMTPEQLRYKGLDSWAADLVQWLKS